MRFRATHTDTGWPKELQGNSMRYRVTQWDTGWLCKLQGDPKSYRVTQLDTGWPKDIQGDSVSFRVSQWNTGWPKERFERVWSQNYGKMSDLLVDSNSDPSSSALSSCNKATNWCNFGCLCGEKQAFWHATMACYSFKIFQASQAEEFDLLWWPH